jgi:hypothetical protein
VTADGRVVHASESENPDLLWGLRGGGGNFGIVTKLDLRLHPVGPTVFAGAAFYPADDAGALLRAFRDWAADAPDDIAALISLMTAPPLPPIPAEWHGRKVATLLAVSTSPENGAALIRPVREAAEPVADLLGPMPYQAMQTLLDPLWPKGIQAYFKATNLARLDDELIDRLAELSLTAPGPQAEIHVQQMGGAIARVADDATAFPERGMPFVLNVVTGWQDAAVGDAHRDWTREVIRAAADASTGRAYVNFLGDREGARAAYGEETYVRLASLKRAFDPTNVFRLNHNIEPSKGAAA